MKRTSTYASLVAATLAAPLSAQTATIEATGIVSNNAVTSGALSSIPVGAPASLHLEVSLSGNEPVPGLIEYPIQFSASRMDVGSLSLPLGLKTNPYLIVYDGIPGTDELGIREVNVVNLPALPHVTATFDALYTDAFDSADLAWLKGNYLGTQFGSVDWKLTDAGSNPFFPQDLTISLQQFTIGVDGVVFDPHEIPSDDAPRSVYAVDLDGDGDVDVLSASSAGVSWFPNVDGAGTFGPQVDITTSAGGARVVHANDLDGDGDVDVLSASLSTDLIAWYENTDGLGSWPGHLITHFPVNVVSVYSTDLDGDGDVDVLSANDSDNTVAWYENTDGLGSFSSGNQHLIWTSGGYPQSVFATDLDGDGDPDVLAALATGDKILWFENTGGPWAFGPPQVITTATDFASDVYAADLDGDGDADVLSASSLDQKLAWYENTDGLGTFGPQQVINTAAVLVESVHAADLDGDGDVDVLSAQYNEGVVWYENTDGQGTFGPQQVITAPGDIARSVYAADLDGDGDPDILSDSGPFAKVDWYENSLVSSPWRLLGQGLVGSAGVPVLTGMGSLAGDTGVMLSLSNAKPLTSAFLVIGASELNSPLLGGTLVPAPTLMIANLPVDAAGKLVFGTAWPAGLPAGSNLYYQYWIADDGGVFGASASNGLQSTTP